MEWINGFVNESAAWISLFGFLLSIFGVFLTYGQARQARLAAEDAKSAAESAGQKVIGFDASVALYNAVEILHRISELVGRAEWSEANGKCVDVRKLLRRASSARVPILETSDELVAVGSYLNVLTNNLLAKIDNGHVSLDIVEIQAALANHIVALAGLCELLRQREVTI